MAQGGGRRRQPLRSRPPREGGRAPCPPRVSVRRGPAGAPGSDGIGGAPLRLLLVALGLHLDVAEGGRIDPGGLLGGDCIRRDMGGREAREHHRPSVLSPQIVVGPGGHGFLHVGPGRSSIRSALQMVAPVPPADQVERAGRGPEGRHAARSDRPDHDAVEVEAVAQQADRVRGVPAVAEGVRRQHRREVLAAERDRAGRASLESSCVEARLQGPDLVGREGPRRPVDERGRAAAPTRWSRYESKSAAMRAEPIIGAGAGVAHAARARRGAARARRTALTASPPPR